MPFFLAPLIAGLGGAAGAAAAGVGAAATVAGGIIQGKENKKAAKDQQRLQQEARDKEIEMFEQARGRDGSAVLPLYFAQGLTQEDMDMLPPSMVTELAKAYQIDVGNLSDAQVRQSLSEMTQMPFEQQLSYIYRQNALLAPTAAQVQSQLQPTIDAMSGAQEATNDFVRSIFDNSLTNEEIQNLQPVQEARLQAAEAERQAQLEALQGALGQISANRQAQGMGATDSLAQQLVGQRARAGAATAGARASSLAKLQNAIDKMNIQSQGIARKGQSLSLPTQQVQNQGVMMTMPTTVASNAAVTAQQPMNFLRLGEARPPSIQPLTTAQGNSTLAQLLTGAGQIANQVGGAMQQNRTNDMLKKYIDGLTYQRTPVPMPDYNDITPNPNERYA